MRGIDSEKLPNLIVIGAAKCGTTSLHTYLGEHPDIFATEQKELHFFIAGEEWTTWSRGLEWYREHFRPGKNHPVRMESSPGYSYDEFALEAAARMHKVVPRTKLIYLIRDPLQRMRSHYTEELYGGRLPRSVTLEDVLRSKGKGNDIASQFFGRFVKTSKYWTQLRRFNEYFDWDRILVLKTEALAENTTEVVRRIFEFVGVFESVVPQSIGDRKNVREEKRLRRWDPVSPFRKIPGYSQLSRHVPSSIKIWYDKLTGENVGHRSLTRIERGERQYVKEILNPEVEMLESELGLDLSKWSIRES